MRRDATRSGIAFDGNALYATAPAVTLGSVGDAWDAVYATNGTIQTADSALMVTTPLSCGLAELLNVETVRFQWTSQADLPADDPAKNYYHYGVCADQLVGALPDLVHTDAALLNYAELIPVCINAIRDLNARLTQTDQTLSALNANLLSLQQISMRLGSYQQQFTADTVDHAQLASDLVAFQQQLNDISAATASIAQNGSSVLQQANQNLEQANVDASAPQQLSTGQRINSATGQRINTAGDDPAGLNTDPAGNVNIQQYINANLQQGLIVQQQIDTLTIENGTSQQQVLQLLQ